MMPGCCCFRCDADVGDGNAVDPDAVVDTTDGMGVVSDAIIADHGVVVLANITDVVSGTAVMSLCC